MAFEFHSTAKLSYREIDTFASRLNFKFVKICFSFNVAWKIMPRKVDIPIFITTKTLSIQNVNEWWFKYLCDSLSDISWLHSYIERVWRDLRLPFIGMFIAGWRLTCWAFLIISGKRWRQNRRFAEPIKDEGRLLLKIQNRLYQIWAQSRVALPRPVQK